MANSVTASQSYKNFTATTTIAPGDSSIKINLLGIFVSSSTAGTIKIQDDSNTVVNTFAVDGGVFYPIPASCKGTVTITVGETLDATSPSVRPSG